MNEQTNKQTNERKYKRTNEQTNEGRKNERTNERTNKRMNEQTKERKNKRANEQTNEWTNEQTNERKTYERTKKQTKGNSKEWTNKRTNERSNQETNIWIFSITQLCISFSCSTHFGPYVDHTNHHKGLWKTCKYKSKKTGKLLGCLRMTVFAVRSIKCTCSECVYLALVMQRDVRIFIRIFVCGLSGCTLTVHIISTNGTNFGKTSFATKRVFRFSVRRGKFPSKNTTIIWLKWWYL